MIIGADNYPRRLNAKSLDTTLKSVSSRCTEYYLRVDNKFIENSIKNVQLREQNKVRAPINITLKSSDLKKQLIQIWKDKCDSVGNLGYEWKEDPELPLNSRFIHLSRSQEFQNFIKIQSSFNNCSKTELERTIGQLQSINIRIQDIVKEHDEYLGSSTLHFANNFLENKTNDKDRRQLVLSIPSNMKQVIALALFTQHSVENQLITIQAMRPQIDAAGRKLWISKHLKKPSGSTISLRLDHEETI